MLHSIICDTDYEQRVVYRTRLRWEAEHKWRQLVAAENLAYEQLPWRAQRSGQPIYWIRTRAEVE